jgi:hypothetical protein
MEAWLADRAAMVIVAGRLQSPMVRCDWIHRVSQQGRG